MNMISTGAFLTEVDASSKENTALKRLVSAWEKKNSKVARAGGVSLMAISLAACGDDDTTPFSQTDVDAAKTAALTGSDGTVHATVDAAVTSNDAAVTTAALTASNGTVYADVNAAVTAGSNTSNADAVTAALTASDGTVYSDVNAAVAAGAAGVDITTDNAAAIAAELSGTGFSSVADLNAAYLSASGTTPAVNAALGSTAATYNGSSGNDAYTASGTTYVAGHLVVDASSTDSDTLTVTTTDDVTATPTIAGIENINFNLDAVTTAGTANTYEVASDNIKSGTITVSVTKVNSPVTAASVTGINDGVTVASSHNMTLAGAANANVTFNATKATAQTLTAQTGTIDDLTIVKSGSGLLTITDADAEENISITAGGGVTITDLTAATDTLSTLTINAGGAITITDSNNVGTISASTSSGNITVGAGDLDATGNITLSTSAGNVTVTNADDSTKTLTVTASGDADANAAAADGDITITAASLAETVVLTATGDINLDDVEAAGTLTLTAGQASAIANTVSDVQTVSVASNSTGATAVKFTAAAGDGTNNGATDGLIELDTVTFTGSNSVTFAMSMVDINIAEASTENSTTAAAVIATDSMTGGTSRFEFSANGGGVAIDASKLAVDVIGINAALHASDSMTIASGQVLGVAIDQTADIAVTAAAVAGNALTVRIEDDASATAVNDLSGITATNVGTLTLDLQDAASTAAGTTGAINVGTANGVVVTGASALNVSGAVTAATFNASAATGAITISALNATTAFTLGSGDDTATSGGDTNFNVDGGAGNDTLVLAAQDYSNNTLTIANMEVLNINASGVTLAGSQVHGKSYVISADNAADTLAINATVGTGETIDVSGTATNGAVTVTGGAGGDTIIGSSTTGMSLAGAAGADVVTGGAGADTVTFVVEAGAGDTITLGGGNDTVKSTTATAATIQAITITDFDAGTATTAKDVLQLSDTMLTGLGTTTDLVDTSANSAANGNGTVVKVTTDGGTIANADLVVLSQTYATDALALAGMAANGSDTITYGAALTDNDSFLVAYGDGSGNTKVAVATTAGGTLTTSAGLDSLATIITLTGVDHTLLDSNDYSTIT